MVTRIPTYSPHLRIQCSGQFGPSGGAWEIFSYGLSMAGSNEIEISESFLNGLVDDMVSFHQDPASSITGTARLTSVKVAYVNPDGKWLGAKPLLERTMDVGGRRPMEAIGMNNAPQVALAVTLRTALNTPRTRGRFYLPVPALKSQFQDGLVPAADALQVATRVAQLVADLNNSGGIDTNDTDVVVASTFGGVPKVTSISVGRVLDTIRSRRNAIRESYVSAGLPA